MNKEKYYTEENNVNLIFSEKKILLLNKTHFIRECLRPWFPKPD